MASQNSSDDEHNAVSTDKTIAHSSSSDDDTAPDAAPDDTGEDAESDDTRPDSDNERNWKTIVAHSNTVPIEMAHALSEHYGDDIDAYERELYSGILHHARGKHVDLRANAQWAQLCESRATSFEGAFPHASWLRDAVHTWWLHLVYGLAYLFSAAFVYVFASWDMTGFDGVIVAALLASNAYLHLSLLSPFGNRFLRQTMARGYLRGVAPAHARRVFLRLCTVSVVLQWLLDLSPAVVVLLIASNALISFLWCFSVHENVLSLRRFFYEHTSPYMCTICVAYENDKRVIPDPRTHRDGFVMPTYGGARVYVRAQMLTNVMQLASDFTGMLMSSMCAAGTNALEYARSGRENDDTDTLQRAWARVVLPNAVSLKRFWLMIIVAGAAIYGLQLCIYYSFLEHIVSGVSNALDSIALKSSPYRYVPFVIACIMPLLLVQALTHSTVGVPREKLLRNFVLVRVMICEGFMDACVYLAMTSALMLHNDA